MVSSVYLWDKLVRSNVTKALLLVAIALFSICPPLFSQASNSAIAGAVYDQSHAVVGGATVSVTDVARGDTRTLVTDSGGEYAANNLIPGIYSVKAEAKVAADPEYRKALHIRGFEAQSNTPEQLAAFLESNYLQVKPVIERLGLQVD